MDLFFRKLGDEGKPLPRDGVAFGHLKVTGPWVCARYYNEPAGPAHDQEGWFSTGDVATIDADGYMQITDRSKDVIKSGGEWISSIELENTAVAHPDVIEAAAIGIARSYSRASMNWRRASTCLACIASRMRASSTFT